MPRIEPVHPPYDTATLEHLTAVMPPGVEPILLFRTFARNLPMAAAMRRWGSYELSRDLSLPMRQREILIDRTCARCRCEYEWGVHVAVFAERVGLDRDQVASLTHGGPDDDCWTDETDRLLVRTADALHESATISDELHRELAEHFEDHQLLDIFLLCGWYHAISCAANAAAVEREPGTPAFAHYRPG